MQWLAIVANVVAIATITQGQPSIPSRELGFVYKNGQADAQVKLAAYVDLTCPDSQAAFPTLLQVADSYLLSQVQLKLYLFSLPYHRNSHTLSKAAHVLRAFKSPKGASVYDWFAAVYGNIDFLTTSATLDKTDTDVLNFAAGLANNISGISTESFKAGVTNVDIDSAARLEWKYGCTRGVYGTPTFTLNDVFVNAESTWSVAQWTSLIDGLLNENKKRILIS